MSDESFNSLITQQNTQSISITQSQDSLSSHLTTNDASSSSLQLDESLYDSQSTPKGWINEHFARIIKESKVIRQCTSPGCKKEYAAATSTTVFKRHWLKCHSESPLPRRTRFTFHDALHINRLIRAIIDLHLDFSIVDKPSFRLLMESMNSNKRLIGRKTVSQIITQSRETLEKEITNVLSRTASVALTFDIWSARKGSRGFGCLTAHFISSNWKLEEVILQFKQLRYPHDAEAIKEFVVSSIESHSLAGKVVSITTDNASNNIAAVRQLGNVGGLTELNLDLVHYKCVAHIIDLGLRAALKQLNPTVTPVREAVLSIRSSRKRKEKFLQIQAELIESGEQDTESPLELAEDVDHRWNSAYVLIERAVRLQKAIDRMIETTSGMESLDKIDWSPVTTIMQFLKPFYEATKRLCFTTQVTITIVSSITPKLMNHCVNFEENESQPIGEAAKLLREKLGTYELEIYNSIVNLAYLLDPRLKTKNLSDTMAKSVSDHLKKLIDSVPNPREIPPNIDAQFCDESDDEEQIDELSSYLMSRREKSQTDIIDWWGANSYSFPKLAHLARRLLPIQATSVASERVFSISGDVDTKERNRLSDENVENIVLFKSWLKFLNVE